MKLQILLSLFLVTFLSVMHAQAPQGLQYQAVIRNFNGDPLLNTSVSFRFTIESENGSQIYYQENQTTTSNALGGIILVIGAGNSTQGNFENINWKSGTVRVNIELDPVGGQNYSPFGTTQFKSVPYALYAQQAHSLIDGNGIEWVPEDDLDEQMLTVNGNQLSISNGNVVVLPTGSGGGDNWGDQSVETNTTLAGDGTLTSPLKLAAQGATNGDVLKWNGTTWTPQDDINTTYTAGNGIAINGSVINNTGDNDNNASNEIQMLSINGNTLSLTNGGSVNLPVVNYSAGTGIAIAANTISAQNTTSLWNANQLRGFPVSPETPALGQFLKYVSGGWTPAQLPNTFWQASGNNIYYSGGNIGLGVSIPESRLHIFNEDKIQMDDQTFGKWASISIEFTSNIVPQVDDSRSLGTISRRWDSVFATDGTINTSDAREKTNIQNLTYGLDEVMKLRPISFSWIARPQCGTKLGLIAQEVESILPEVVVNPKRNPSMVESEEEGSDRLGMYYSDLIPVLIKSIQEQQMQIKQLQEEIALLKK